MIKGANAPFIFQIKLESLNRPGVLSDYSKHDIDFLFLCDIIKLSKERKQKS
jgi:hypothetical protein